jgi:isopenicillin N synthase-like dioxygenase
MKNGGTAWRGWFKLGEELTSGKPDQKEGLYLGQELSDDHPRVLVKSPLHGRNQFPERPAELGATIIEW